MLNTPVTFTLALCVHIGPVPFSSGMRRFIGSKQSLFKAEHRSIGILSLTKSHTEFNFLKICVTDANFF
jgi:hypothetical protein